MDSVVTKDLTEWQSKVKKLIFSDKKNKDFEFTKITIRPFTSKGEVKWQLEQFKGAQVFIKISASVSFASG